MSLFQSLGWGNYIQIDHEHIDNLSALNILFIRWRYEIIIVLKHVELFFCMYAFELGVLCLHTPLIMTSSRIHGPLARYVQLRDANAENVFPPTAGQRP